MKPGLLTFLKQLFGNLFYNKNKHVKKIQEQYPIDVLDPIRTPPTRPLFIERYLHFDESIFDRPYVQEIVDANANELVHLMVSYVNSNILRLSFVNAMTMDFTNPSHWRQNVEGFVDINLMQLHFNVRHDVYIHPDKRATIATKVCDMHRRILDAFSVKFELLNADELRSIYEQHPQFYKLIIIYNQADIPFVNTLLEHIRDNDRLRNAIFSHRM